jgi:hypothetical protein
MKLGFIADLKYVLDLLEGWLAYQPERNMFWLASARQLDFLSGLRLDPAGAAAMRPPKAKAFKETK